MEITREVISFSDVLPPQTNVRDEVLAGLTAPDKTISPKFFYDARGSRLFEAITRTPEYYPTRTEIALMREFGADMAAAIGPDTVLIELGSGSSVKIRLLLEALRPHLYVPVDISREFLLQSAERLVGEYPWLDVHVVCLDFTQPFSLPLPTTGHRRLAFFPGSSIGNFTPEEAQRFLEQVRDLVGEDGALLIGVDLQKDETVLDAAYNDAEGWTEAFNLNALLHLNRLLNGNFDPNRFRHIAYYDAGRHRIEMHLEARVSHRVQLAGQEIDFRAGERIHTENSYKYTRGSFEDLAATAGFSVDAFWTDDKQYFGVFLLN